jgi:hypothetical protein
VAVVDKCLIKIGGLGSGEKVCKIGSKGSVAGGLTSPGSAGLDDVVNVSMVVDSEKFIYNNNPDDKPV